MVNNTINVSAYQGQPPTNVQGGRIYIQDGPLYLPRDVLALLDLGDESTKLVTTKCRKDVQVMGFDIADVRQLVDTALNTGKYLKSEWCLVGQTDSARSWAACDGYRLLRDEWVEHAHKEMRIEYYVKFAIGKTGKLLLLVSCHLS
ncbi:hypothetical protein [Oceanisphaera avium]|uniref:Uncharacterized protein n=1 Tax=Oceanisphaera avium TaxID=1903694 RepID=A0A1Y0CUF8_9GAMM|nr:hypothetical protein [Oceanisphaera avium]ART78922.1 hypothetical protein CBP12_01135 [Oceanisphaera avium]